MDIQTRKLEFIREFLKVENEELISTLESILKTNEAEYLPFSKDEFNYRIEVSLKDSENNEVVKSHDLMYEIKDWH